MEIAPIRTEAEPDTATVTSEKDKTDYLLAIPGMKESILEGMNTPVGECDDAIEW